MVRENTEGFYADRNIESGSSEMLVTADVVISLRRITRLCCERIARSAFELAMTRSEHVTIVHKANVLKIGDGMFIAICHAVGKEFPEVKVDDFIVDAMMAHVVRAPQRFDVIVTTNMFGDILSDLTAELSGSLGLGGSLNAGSMHAMGQAAHGSASDIAGKNIANPFSLILSAGMLLSWYGQRKGLQAFLDAIAAAAPSIQNMPVPLVLDHFAMAPEAAADDDARLDVVLSLLRSGQAYVKLSAPYRLASTPAVADALATRLAALYVKTNPGQLLWGSDWPHTNREPGKAAHETSAYQQLAPRALLRGIESWLPDASVRRQVLVENPARWYGF